MSTGQGNGGDFEIPDETGAPTDLNTLFGVNQAVGQAPVLLRRGQPTVNRPVDYKGPLLPNEVRGAGPSPASADTSTTITGALQAFYGMTPDALIDLQTQLYQAGFYGDTYYSAKGKKPQFGTYDDDTYNAYKKAVVQAARSGQPLPDLIGEAGKARAAMAAGASQQAVQFTHPDDLRYAFDQTGPRTIGRRPDATVVDNAIAVYHELESQAANKADEKGNVVAPPSPTAFAEEYLRRTYPADAYRNGYADAYAAFANLLGGSNG